MVPSVESITKRIYITSWRLLLVTLRAFGMMPVGLEFLPDKMVIKRSRTWELLSASMNGTLIVLFPLILYTTYDGFEVNFLRKMVMWSIALKCFFYLGVAVTLNAKRQRLVDIARYFLVYCSVHPLRTTAYLKLLLVTVFHLLNFLAQCVISSAVYYSIPRSHVCPLWCLTGRLFLDCITCSVFSLTDGLFCKQVALLRQMISDLNVDVKEVASSLIEPPTAQGRPPRSRNNRVGSPGRDTTRSKAKPTLIFVVPKSDHCDQAPELPSTDTESHTPIETLQVDLNEEAPPRRSGTSEEACGMDIGHQPETWRRLRLRQAYLYSLFKALNREYTWANLCSVLIAFIETTLALYYSVAAEANDSWKYSSYVWGSLQYIRLCVVALICQLTSDQVTTTSNLLNKVLSSRCLTEEAREEVRGFFLQNTVLDVRFRVGDFIPLDFSMIVTITGAVSTYLVILLQQYPTETMTTENA